MRVGERGHARLRAGPRLPLGRAARRASPHAPGQPHTERKRMILTGLLNCESGSWCFALLLASSSCFLLLLAFSCFLLLLLFVSSPYFSISFSFCIFSCLFLNLHFFLYKFLLPLLFSFDRLVSSQLNPFCCLNFCFSPGHIRRHI